jgi:pSer/pThr/pTyr-binding forkhead associated (FHA) protein
MLKINLRFSGNFVDKYQFDQDLVVIGRNTTCDMVLDNLGVSREHAQIERSAGVYVLHDLGSNNGTFVNGKRVDNYNLNSGDEFSIGKFTFEVDLGLQAKPQTQRRAAPPQSVGSNPELTLAVDAREMEMMQRERASKLKAYITYVAPSGKKQNQPVVKTITFFGKALSCEFNVGGFFIYPKHACLVRDQNGFRLINLAPRRITRLNEKEIDDERLQHGDTFRIGKTVFEFYVGVPPSKTVR